MEDKTMKQTSNKINNHDLQQHINVKNFLLGNEQWATFT
jgi:hypothetical protein